MQRRERPRWLSLRLCVSAPAVPGALPLPLSRSLCYPLLFLRVCLFLVLIPSTLQSLIKTLAEQGADHQSPQGARRQGAHLSGSGTVRVSQCDGQRPSHGQRLSRGAPRAAQMPPAAAARGMQRSGRAWPVRRNQVTDRNHLVQVQTSDLGDKNIKMTLCLFFYTLRDLKKNRQSAKANQENDVQTGQEYHQRCRNNENGIKKTFQSRIQQTNKNSPESFNGRFEQVEESANLK